MTDQEQLNEAIETIKDLVKVVEAEWGISDKHIADVEWLTSIVMEQQKEIEGRKDFESRRIHQVKNLIERNKRYKRALEYYADKRNYVSWNSMAISETEINRDQGKRARKELGCEE